LIRVRLVSDPGEIEGAWREQYEKLARVFAGLIPRTGTVVEVGCGRGRLTFPLARLAVKSRFIAVDRFAGPYSKDRRVFTLGLSRERLKGRVRLVASDYLEWLRRQRSRRYDGVISCEFLCEIDSAGMRSFLSECYRILKPAGVTVHAFLSPFGRNSHQRLFIEADSDPRWTRFPPKEWFSPSPRLVASELRRVGFGKCRVTNAKSKLTIRADAARVSLKSWGVKEAFYTFHDRQIDSDGLELPAWVIVAGQKGL